MYPSGNQQNGRFEGNQWHPEQFAKPDPNAVPPEPMPTDHHTRALRAMGRAALKLDHFQAIYRLEKKYEGSLWFCLFVIFLD